MGLRVQKNLRMSHEAWSTGHDIDIDVLFFFFFFFIRDGGGGGGGGGDKI